MDYELYVGSSSAKSTESNSWIIGTKRCITTGYISSVLSRNFVRPGFLKIWALFPWATFSPNTYLLRVVMLNLILWLNYDLLSPFLFYKSIREFLHINDKNAIDTKVMYSEHIVSTYCKSSQSFSKMFLKVFVLHRFMLRGTFLIWGYERCEIK